MHKAQGTFRMQKLIFIINLKHLVRFRVLKMTWLFNLSSFREWDLQCLSPEQSQGNSTQAGSPEQPPSRWVCPRVEAAQQLWCAQCQGTKSGRSLPVPPPKCRLNSKTIPLSRLSQVKINKWWSLFYKVRDSIKLMISRSPSFRILYPLPVLGPHLTSGKLRWDAETPSITLVVSLLWSFV